MIGTLGHFNLLEEIGVGGLGRVYRARDTVHGRTVLIKVAPSELTEPGMRHDRFLASARAAAALSHRNLAVLFDIGETDDRLYLIIEFVPGETLGQAMARGPQHVRTAVDLGIQLADALAEVHGHGLVHGDVKPETVRVNPKGNAKLLESGLVPWTRGGRLRHPSSAQAEPDVALAIETTAYFSPEQARGEPFDERSDLFSLGAVLYELLTASSPFRKSTVAATMANVLDGTPRPPSDFNPDVPESLDELVRRAIGKAPDERFQSAASFAAELRAVAAILDIRSGDSEPPVVVDTPGRRGRRRGGLAAMTQVATVALVVLGVAGGGWWLAGDLLRQAFGGWFGPPPAPVVAVSPLEFDGGGARYFADGLSEDLAVRLGQIPGLFAVGRTGLRDRRGDVPAALGEELHVGAVLRGSLETRDDGVDLDLELIDAANGATVWCGRHTASFTDIFACQTEIAESVTAALGLELGPSPARARKKSTFVTEEGYDLYLRGRDAVAQRDAELAVELFERVIKAGEGFAELYAALSYALHPDPSPAAHERLGEVAALATASDPDLPQAQVARGMAAETRGESLTYFRRAVELDPSYAFAYAMIGAELAAVDPELAARFEARARAVDPRLDGGGERSRDRADGASTLGETERRLLQELLQREIQVP